MSKELAGALESACSNYKVSLRCGFADLEGAATIFSNELDRHGFTIVRKVDLDEAVSLLMDSKSIATAWNFQPVGSECAAEMRAHELDIESFLAREWSQEAPRPIEANDKEMP